ncbi:MAG: pilin, partial [Arenimonas sp.]
RTEVTEGGRIVAEFSAQSPQKANAALSGSRLLFTPLAKGEQVEWQCSSDTLKQKWCPRLCTCQ